MARTPNGRVLIAYALLQWPLRKTLEDHLYGFRRYGERRYDYVNLAVPGMERAYSHLSYDAVLWHTSVLSWLRWSPETQHAGLLRRSARLRGSAAWHGALPQDEFLRTDLVNRFLGDTGVDHVFSVAPASEWPKIYDGLDLDRVGVSRVLTGYLDDGTLGRIDGILAEDHPRDIDIGYRTVPGKPFLGRHAILKAEMADVVRVAAEARGMKVDISTRREDTFYGDDWYRFLASCRWTIGIEGGASVLDRDGSVRVAVERYLAEHPDAGYEEVERACFPGRDGELGLQALSPRHLEACATRTPQLLVEGEYGGILRPGDHYLELRRDLSNLDEVLDAVQAGGDTAGRLADRAHADVVASGEYTYRRLVEDVEAVLPAPSRPGAGATPARVSGAVDTAARPLIPLATKALMPVRRRVLGALGSAEYARDGTPAAASTSRRVGGVLVLYHRPQALFHSDADTVLEHASAFERHSGLGVVSVNTDLGFPAALKGLEFDAVILHYSLFGLTEYRLDDSFMAYLERSGAYTVAFFQDEYCGVPRRLDLIRRLDVDCVYTCLAEQYYETVYGSRTPVHTLRTNLTGYVGPDLVAAAERYGVPDADRTVDVGYRGRPLPAYLGRGAQEKTEIGAGFAERAADSGLALDIELGEQDRIYGADWHRFVANCRCMLGVESGASAFDLDGEVMAEYERLSAEQGRVSVDDLTTLDGLDEAIPVRTVSPRHFEAAAFRVCQILFEGEYVGVLEAGRHYIPLRKDFSNIDEVIERARDPEVRRELTENAYQDLIASGDYSYERFVGGVDDTLRAAGVEPLRDADGVRRELARGLRVRAARTQAQWLRHGLRYRARWAREQVSRRGGR
ncbi:MAG TPA: hypothetical protein VEX39_07815 [Thermoleophilaceae bacterium]|nr:hypothetical protein [Thermoleophilaceae bacterium]